MQSCFGTFFFHFHRKKLFQIIATFCTKMVSSVHPKLLIFLPPVFTPPSSESKLSFLYDAFCTQIKQIGRSHAPLSDSFAYRKPSCLSIFHPGSGFLSTVQVTHQDNQELRDAHFFESSSLLFMTHAVKGFPVASKT